MPGYMGTPSPLLHTNKTKNAALHNNSSYNNAKLRRQSLPVPKNSVPPLPTYHFIEIESEKENERSKARREDGDKARERICDHHSPLGGGYNEKVGCEGTVGVLTSRPHLDDGGSRRV